MSQNVTEETTENKTAIEITNNTYRLAEMAEAMKQSLENAIKVNEEQNELIELILSTDRAVKFRDFTKEVEAQIDEGKKQIKTLKIRELVLEQVVEACKQDENVERVVNMLLKALGVFEN